jgi:transcriptional regulator of acetoin/glycerol metabolism
MVSSLALPIGTDPRRLSRAIATAHEGFVGSGRLIGRAGRSVRSVVLDSWTRSAGSGVDPDRVGAPTGLLGSDLADYRAAHPLRQVLPLIRTLLVADAEETGHIVAVTDADGLLLWVEGNRELRSMAEQINFAPGAQWGESVAGTNAPGLAIATDRAVQVFSAEHFSRQVQPWSCSAAPIHDPISGVLLGAIDLTGGDYIAAPHTLALVKATAAAAEAELRLNPPRRIAVAKPRAAVLAAASLAVLGRDSGLLRLPDREVKLSQRHAELLLVLTRHPNGLTADELAVRITETDGAQVTVRAEVSRLRHVVGEHVVDSRPYRLVRPLATDVDAVRALLRRGAYRRALDCYPGPVLPRSTAPEVERLRTEVALELRSGILQSGSAEVLLRYFDTVDDQDVEILEAALRGLPAGAPRRAALEARAASLELDLGATSLQRSGN